jgi:hypothetical protein
MNVAVQMIVKAVQGNLEAPGAPSHDGRTRLPILVDITSRHLRFRGRKVEVHLCLAATSPFGKANSHPKHNVAVCLYEQKQSD